MNWACLTSLCPAALLVACRPAVPEIAPEEPTLRRLTEAQYDRSVRALLGGGDDLFVPSGLEPDVRLGGLVAIGSSQAATSPRGVENFESAAFALAAQGLAVGRRDRILSCEPSGTVDATCAQEFVTSFGLRAWRRPLTDAEISSLVEIAGASAETLGDFHEGLEFALAAILMSPHFVYRVELGEPDPEGRWERRFSGHELASRLSFLIWNQGPDDELLTAAGAGELDDEQGLADQVDRLLEDPRARDGLGAWLSDMLHLDDLDDMEKDPFTFVHVTETLGQAARTETLMGFNALAFDDEGDLRDLVTTRRTFLDRELATLYDVRAPTPEGFGEFVYADEDMRRGLLGQASILALNAHPVSSSPTLRGLFVQQVLLCHTLPGPPAGVDTSIPAPTDEARTLRDRVLRHLEDPACAGCHELMDPVGLGLENFDGIGRYRTHDEGALIDASGDLDGGEFTNPAELADVLHDHPDFAPCLATTLTRYATGQQESFGTLDGVDWLAGEFAFDKHRLEPLVQELALSPMFRQAGALDTTAEPEEGGER